MNIYHDWLLVGHPFLQKGSYNIFSSPNQSPLDFCYHLPLSDTHDFFQPMPHRKCKLDLLIDIIMTKSLFLIHYYFEFMNYYWYIYQLIGSKNITKL